MRSLTLIKEKRVLLLDLFWQNSYVLMMFPKMKKARYIFSIGDQDFEICFATLSQIFGLGQEAYIAGRKVLINKKLLGLKLLNKACQVNLKSSPELLKDYWLFKK